MPIPSGPLPLAGYLGAEEALVDIWVRIRFAGVEEELNEISPGLADRVYQDYAEPGTPYPFIIFQCQDKPRDVRGVGVVRVMVDTLYLVKAVAQVDTYAPLVPVARVIDRAMTSPDVTPVEDGFVLASMRQDQFSMVEVDAGKQFRHFGGQYRIQAQAHQ